MTKEINVIMNTIFDLQRFADFTTYTAGSVNESINVAPGENGITAISVAGGANTFTVKTNTEAETGGTEVNAGSGNDSITVNSGISGYSITGARGNDVISIASGAGGNTYVYSNGDGKDSIYGWTESDTLFIKDADYQESMSADGKDYILKIGSYSVTFKDIAAGTKVNIKDRNGTVSQKTSPKWMLGTASAESIINTVALGDDKHAGTSDTDYWSIYGAASNDSIVNDQNFVYLDGGTGHDAISVGSANGTDLTEGVSIYGGYGNDTIYLSDSLQGTTSGQHKIYYKVGDGNDSIVGWNDGDSLFIQGLSTDNKTKLIAKSDVDSLGNYNLQIGSYKVIIAKRADGALLGGTTINIYDADNGNAQIAVGTPVDSDGKPITSGTADHYTIPKKVLLSTSNDSETYTGENYDNYTIDASSGNDNIAVGSAAMSVAGGANNDVISIGGAKSIDTLPSALQAATKESDLIIADNVVTIYGGYGNDSINALNDTVNVTIGTGEDTQAITARSAHVYQFGVADGTDSIYGFNENDTIEILGTLTEDQVNAIATNSKFDYTGRNYLVKIGSTTVTLVLDNNYKGGKTLNVKYNNQLVAIGTGVDADGKPTSGTPDHYIIPNILRGSESADTVASQDANYRKLVNREDNYTIQALGSNDIIENQGASNVLIEAGTGNDTIYLQNDGAATNPKYGENVTVYGGTGNDSIINESVGEDADSKAPTHTYKFGYNDGNDTIKFFGEKDTISIAAGSHLVQASVKGDDLVMLVAKTGSNYVQSRIYLTDYAKGAEGKERSVYVYSEDDHQESVVYVPRVIIGTSGADTTLDANTAESYTISLLGGNDNYTNKGFASTVIGDSGNDTIVNVSSASSLSGGYGNDVIKVGFDADHPTDVVDAAENTVDAGYGNDTIIGSTGNGNIYLFGTGEGTNYILNYQDGADVIQLRDSITADAANSWTKEITDNGVIFTIGTPGTSTATKVIVKGALKTGKNDGSQNPDDYENLPYDFSGFIRMKANAEAVKYTDYEWTVEKVLYGTNGNDTGTGSLVIANDKSEVTVDARSGNDSVKSEGNEISIAGGYGNDTISLGGGAQSNTVYGGRGNDSIKSNGNENVFEYHNGDGDDTIVGFSDADTIHIVDENYTAELINGGYKIKIGDGSIFLAGAVGGSAVNILKRDGTEATEIVDKKIFGTNVAEALTNADDEYKIDALNGNDTITNSGNSVSINAGMGNDEININGGTDVTVKAGLGNDTVNVQHNEVSGHLYEFSYGDGINVINGINVNDTIHITNEGSGIKSASLEGTGADAYYVLTLNDSVTQIKLKESDGSAYKKPGTLVKSFSIKFGTSEPEEYPIPQIIELTNATGNKDTVLAAADDTAVVYGKSGENVITNTGASFASINAGDSNDTIEVQVGEENTIIGGTGNDSIKLSTGNHVIRYAYGDGDDTITGWQDTDTLNVTGVPGAFGIATVMTGTTFALKFGGNTITFEGSKPDDVINIVSDFTPAVLNTFSEFATNIDTESKSFQIVIPKVIQGTTGSDNGANALMNTEDNYRVNADAGNDKITNSGAFVTVDAGIGDDTVFSSGDYVSIQGGYGVDSIVVNHAQFNTIDGGETKDIVSIGSDVLNSTIIGGKGNDTLYGNASPNTFVYNSGDESDTILGFNENDTIKLVGTDIKPISASDTNPKIKTTDKGLLVYLTDGNILTIRGNKSSGKGDNNNEISDFDFYGGTTIKFDVDGNVQEVTVPREKVVSKNVAFKNVNENYLIKGTALADTISNTARNVQINGGLGDDIIQNTGNIVSIAGGIGNDTIVLHNQSIEGTGYAYLPDEIKGDVTPIAQDVTVSGGEGNDIIYSNTNGVHHYEYASGDGKDVIYNFGTATDVIDFATTVKSAADLPFTKVDVANYGENNADLPYFKDVVFQVGVGTITLKKVHVDSTVNYTYWVKANEGDEAVKHTGSYVVPRKHQMSASETTFNNTTDDYAVSGTSKDDVITNSGKRAVINGDSGDNQITNNTDGISSRITATYGNDIIINAAMNVTIGAGDGLNQITNSATANGADITAGKDADTITNSATRVQINAGDGDNQVTNNSGANEVTITTGAGDDTIDNRANNVTINTGAGDDVVSLNAIGATSNIVSVEGGIGNDTIYGQTTGGRTYVYNSGDGDDVIVNWTTDDAIYLNLNAGDYYEKETTAEGLVFTFYDSTKAKTGSITISELVNNERVNPTGGIPVHVYGKLDGVDTEFEAEFTTEKVRFANGATALNVPSSDFNFSIKGTDADNTIINSGDNNSILAGKGNDTIHESAGNNVYIFGGEGADSILIADSDGDPLEVGDFPTGVTINGGQGKDTIKATRSDNNVGVAFEFATGDGEDTIIGLNNKDTIYVDSDYKTTVDNNNYFVITYGTGYTDSIRIADAYTSGKRVTVVQRKEVQDEDEENEIATQYNVPKLLITTNTSNKVENKGAGKFENAFILGGDKTNDTIENDAESVTISSGAGNDSIVLGDNANVSVSVGAGSDSVFAAPGHTSPVTYVFGNADGANTIVNFEAGDVIEYTGGAWDTSNVRYIQNGSASTDLELTFGTGTTVLLKDYGKAENQVNVKDATGHTSTVTVGKIKPGTSAADNLTLESGKADYEFHGYAGNDKLTNIGNGNVSIYGGDGVDSIIQTGENGYIDGGTGNDLITIQSGSGNTSVNFGAGTDVVVNKDAEANGHVYIFDGGTSTATGRIDGFNTNDTLYIKNTSGIVQPVQTSAFSGDYFLLKIGAATISLKGTGAEVGDTIKIIDSVTGVAYAPDIVVPKAKMGTGAAENITGFAAEYYVNAAAGNDTIENAYADVTIEGGDGKDLITNKAGGTKASISGGAENDTIVNEVAGDASNVITIYGGAGNDSIKNEGDYVLYQFLTATNEGTNTITGYAAHDTIHFTDATAEPSAVLNADGSQIRITSGKTNVVIAGSAGAFSKNTSINVKYGDTEKSLSPSVKEVTSNNVVLTHDDDGLSVIATASTVTIESSAKTSKITATTGSTTKTIKINANGATSAEEAATVVTGDGNDSITNAADYTSINAGTGVNSITSSGSNVTIVGGAAIDKVTINGGTASSINSGANSDIIVVDNSTNNTIYAAEGNDNITLQNITSGGNTLYFSGTSNEGNDIITGFSAGDTIQFGSDAINISASVSNVTYAKKEETYTETVTVATGETYPVGVQGEYTAGETNTGSAVEVEVQKTREVDDTAHPLSGDTTFTIRSKSNTSLGTIKLNGVYTGDVHFIINGEAKDWTIGTGFPTSKMSENHAAATFDLFEDENDSYTTDSNDLSSITNLGTNNYSAGNLESLDSINIFQNNNLPTATYGKDENQ